MEFIARLMVEDYYLLFLTLLHVSTSIGFFCKFLSLKKDWKTNGEINLEWNITFLYKTCLCALDIFFNITPINYLSRGYYFMHFKKVIKKRFKFH